MNVVETKPTPPLALAREATRGERVNDSALALRSAKVARQLDRCRTAACVSLREASTHAGRPPRCQALSPTQTRPRSRRTRSRGTAKIRLKRLIGVQPRYA
jgi:hypothetical protein